jgi:serine/threonine protein kinase
MKNNKSDVVDLKKVNDLTNFREVYIGNQYKILINRKLGSGSFGDIYLGINLKTKEELAIKLELSDSRTPQLNYESKILKFLQGGEGFPAVHFFGIVGIYNVMIIDLLGPNLEEKFNTCERKFSLKTVLMLGIQMMTRIEFLHSRHFIHRDIKPENFLLGIGKKKQDIFLIDFGLAKRFRDPKTGEHIPYTDGKSLTGTAIYASIYTHLGIEQCRRDDLESLGYVLMYFLRGDLPWFGIKAKTREEKQQKIMELKTSYTPDLLCKSFPEEFTTYFNIVRELQFEEKPNYEQFKNLFFSCLKKNNLANDFNFDWLELEKNYKVKLDLKSELSQILNKHLDLGKTVSENLTMDNKESGGLFGGKNKLFLNFANSCQKEETKSIEIKHGIKIEDHEKPKEESKVDSCNQTQGQSKEEIENHNEPTFKMEMCTLPILVFEDVDASATSNKTGDATIEKKLDTVDEVKHN